MLIHLNEEDCIGVKMEGGVLTKLLREIEVMCLAGNIPEAIEVDVANIFGINRLGITNSYEQGRSLTAGITYKKERLDDINKYFERKIIYLDKMNKK